MFGWFRKREDSNRQGLRDDFVNVTTKLQGAEEVVQMAVGHTINILNTAFITRFKSIAEFRNISASEKFKYIESLTVFEDKIRQKDPAASIGAALFKMWVGALTANDEELCQQFSKGLATLSRKGDLPI